MENIDNLFELIKKDAKNNIVNLPNDKGIKQQFPFEVLHSIWDSLLKIKLDESTLSRLKFYLNHADIRYFTLKYLKIEYYQKNKIEFQCLDSLLSIFGIIPGLELNKQNPKASKESAGKNGEDGLALFALRRDLLTSNSNITDIGVHRKLFNDCFVNFLRNNIDIKLYKKVLVKLPEKILPKMSNPLMMSDFLTRSYNIGGLISVLALNGIFILINNYNLEYPNFFKKLYQLLDASIFYTKYKDKFFQLLDAFLSSTHLSSALVASFIKKLARMSLTCPPADLKFLILFIYNLLIRHPNCKVLIHNGSKRKITDDKDDPFDIECLDFNQSNALKSSLWEIQTLKQHYTAYVSKEVEKLNNLMSVEYQLDEPFENNTYNALIEFELDLKKTPNSAVNYFFDLTEAKSNFKSNIYDPEVSNILKIN